MVRDHHDLCEPRLRVSVDARHARPHHTIEEQRQLECLLPAHSHGVRGLERREPAPHASKDFLSPSAVVASWHQVTMAPDSFLNDQLPILNKQRS